MRKEYFCCICYEKLNYKPTRLVKQEYGAGRYNQYYNLHNYDFCKKCYKKFDNWVKKHNNKMEVSSNEKDICDK